MMLNEHPGLSSLHYSFPSPKNHRLYNYIPFQQGLPFSLPAAPVLLLRTIRVDLQIQNENLDGVEGGELQPVSGKL